MMDIVCQVSDMVPDADTEGVWDFEFSIMECFTTLSDIYPANSPRVTLPFVSCSFLHKKYVKRPCPFSMYGYAVSSP